MVSQRTYPAVMLRIFALLIVGVLVTTAFLSASALAEDKSFGGVGLQVVPTIEGDLVVLNVLDDAPAAEKGLKPGDLIFQVDDFQLKGSDFGKVVAEFLWGPVGTSVELFYRRPGVIGVSRVVVQRSTIDPRLTVTPTVQNGASSNAGSK